MSILWTHTEAAAATGGIAHGAWEASAVEIDSRAVKPGALFLALKGEKSDGHDWLAAAAANGAVAALVERVPENASELPLLVVPNVEQALWRLAEASRQRSAARIVAVTGSVGKTSAKEAIALALSAYGSVHATAGNFNNHLGLPLTLARCPREAEFAVLEMGMNHAGEIAPLSRLARPEVALVTNVDAVHAEFFDSVEGIARAKAEIFEGTLSTAIMPADNPYLSVLMKAALAKKLPHLRYFGHAAAGDMQVTDLSLSREGTRFILRSRGATLPVQLSAVGAHWAMTAAAALTVVDALGLPVQKAIAALAEFREPKGRGRLCDITLAGKAVTLMDDSYNASPVSMKAAIAKLGLLSRSGGRAVAVLGQMLELGEHTAQGHLDLLPALKAARVAKVYATGPYMRPLFDRLPEEMQGGWSELSTDLREKIEAELQSGDIVLVKGSHGSKVYALAEVWQGAKT